MTVTWYMDLVTILVVMLTIHPSSNVYKVVSIHFRESVLDSSGVVSVYTLGSGSGWRNKGETPYSFFSRRPGLLANGAIHWMNKDGDDNKIILSFDLADEKFRIVPSPPAPVPSSNHVDQLGVLGGSFCVTRSVMKRLKSRKDIWVLDIIHNGLGKEIMYLWNRKFSIPWNGMFVEPRAILNNGRLLCRSQRFIISNYDPKTEEVKYFNQIKNELDTCWFEMVPYMKSFVSLKALGQEDAKYFGGRATSGRNEMLWRRPFPCPAKAATT